MRMRPLLFSLVGVSFVGAGALFQLPTVMLWNPSDSMPRGFYWVERGRVGGRGEIAVIDPGPFVVGLLAERGYLAPGVPLLKPIAGVAGDTVCRFGDAVEINGKPMAHALWADRSGRQLPVWSGCVRLADDEVFVLSTHSPDSLDGRYFGTFRRSQIIGKAHQLWFPF